MFQLLWVKERSKPTSFSGGLPTYKPMVVMGPELPALLPPELAPPPPLDLTSISLPSNMEYDISVIPKPLLVPIEPQVLQVPTEKGKCWTRNLGMKSLHLSATSKNTVARIVFNFLLHQLLVFIMNKETNISA